MSIARPGQTALRKSTKVRIDGGTPKQTRDNLTLAKTMLAIAEAQYAKAEYGLPLDTPATAAPTLQRFVLDSYEPWMKRERPDRWEEPARRLQALFFPMFKYTPLDQLRPAAIEAWRAARLETGTVTKRSVARELTYLLGVIAKAIEWEVLDASPLARLDIGFEPSPEIVRYLSEDEYTRLLAALEARDRAGIAARARYNAHRIARGKPPRPTLLHYKDWLTPAVIISIHTGVRRGELFKLEWSAVNWHAGVLTVTALTSKNKRYARHIDMNVTCRQALERWQEQTGRKKGLVFVSERHGQGLTEVQASWDDVLEDAGITAFRWHDLRHTFASWLVQRGEDLLVVSKLLGHRNLKTTMRYAHLAPAQTKIAVGRLDPVKNNHEAGKSENSGAN